MLFCARACPGSPIGALRAQPRAQAPRSSLAAFRAMYACIFSGDPPSQLKTTLSSAHVRERTSLLFQHTPSVGWQTPPLACFVFFWCPSSWQANNTPSVLRLLLAPRATAESVRTLGCLGYQASRLCQASSSSRCCTSAEIMFVTILE